MTSSPKHTYFMTFFFTHGEKVIPPDNNSNGNSNKNGNKTIQKFKETLWITGTFFGGYLEKYNKDIQDIWKNT